MAIAAADRRAVARRRAGTRSGPGTSGGAGARCTGSARSSVPKVPVIRTRSCARPSSPGCSTRISAVETVRPTRSTSTRTSTGPATAADRKCAPQVSTSGCPTAASPDAAAEAPSAMSTPPLIACPISQPSPRWPRRGAHRARPRTGQRGRRRPVECQDLVELGHRVGLLRRRRSCVCGRAYGDPMTGSIHWPTAVLVAGTMLLLGLAVCAAGPQPPPRLPLRGRPRDVRDAAHGIPRLPAPRRRPHPGCRGEGGTPPALHPRCARGVDRRPGQRALVDRRRRPPPAPPRWPWASRPARPAAPSSTARAT